MVMVWMHKGATMVMAVGIGWEHIAILGWRLAVALIQGGYGLGSIKEIPLWLKASMGSKKKRYRGHVAWKAHWACAVGNLLGVAVGNWLHG